MKPTDINRISKNVLGLLLQGQYPGEYAPVLVEAITFITSLINESDKKEEAAHSNIDAKELSGVGTSPV
jgi:hypothetical protein